MPDRFPDVWIREALTTRAGRMAILKERWFLDVVGQRLVRDLRSNIEADLPPVTQGDILDMEIHTVEPTGTGGFRYVDADDLTCRAGIFSLTDEAPTSGKILWGYDGDWTPPQAINASEATILAALNALASITAAGGLTSVTKESAGTYEFTFTEEGEREEILANAEDAYPSSYSKTRRKIVGDVDTIEVQRVTIRANAAAGQTDWDPLDAPVAIVETLSVGNDQVQRITFNVAPVDGQLLLGYDEATVTVDVSRDAADLQRLLEDIDSVGTGNVTVTGDFASGFIVVFAGLTAGDVLPLVANSAGLVGPKGKKAQLEIEGPEVDDLLAGAEEAKVLFEIEMREDSRPHTLLQIEVELRNGRWEPESDTRPPADRILGESVAEARYLKKSWVSKTAAYTAVAGDRLLANTGAGAFTIDLPANPSTGDQVEITDPHSDWATENLTVDRNGNLIEGESEDLVCDTAGAHILLVFAGGTTGWHIIIL